MNDDRLKREIEEALSVEPSPHFTARVRERIAKGPRPIAAWSRWGVAAAGLALVAVVVAVVHPVAPEIVVPKTAKIAVKIEQKEPEATPVPVSQGVVSTARATKPPMPGSREPEVLIDPREVAAFQKFVEGVRDDRIDLKKLMELKEAAAAPAPVQDIALMPIGELEPLTIESLTVGPRGIGGIEGGNL